MRAIFLVLTFFPFHQLSAQTCYTISNRTNGNGNSGTCGSPACSGNSKTGHIDVSFGASCPGIIPSLQLISVTSGALPNPFCFDPGNCISAGTVRYCFRGSNLPSSGFMTIRLTQGALAYNCSYSVNGGSGTILPIKLSSFDTKLQNNTVLVKWTTEEELDNERFEIERSDAGKIFSVIGTVRSLGNSMLPVNYEYKDESPLKGISFYRLKQIDIDGHSSYSSIKRVDNRISGIQIRQVFPNPVNDKANLQIVADKAMMVYVRVYNNEGKQVIIEQRALHAGEQNWQLNTSRLAAGIYEIIIISENGNEISERLIKQ